MKGIDLFKGMGYIDEELAGEALDAGLGEASGAGQARARVRARSRGWMKWGALAACLALAIGWGAWQRGYLGSGAAAPMLSMQSAKSSEDAMTTDAAPAQAAPEAAEEYDYSTNGIFYAGSGPDSLDAAEAEEARTEAAEETPMEVMPTETAAAEVLDIETGDEPAEGAMLPDMPVGEPIPSYEVLTMVSGMPGVEEASYVMPANGETAMSEPLRKAMETYGDTVLYRVALDIFRGAGETEGSDADEEEPLLDPAGAEAQEVMAWLANECGYVTAIETFTDADGSVATWNTLHATYDQLVNFPVDEDHGIMLFLYDEYVK